MNLPPLNDGDGAKGKGEVFFTSPETQKGDGQIVIQIPPALLPRHGQHGHQTALAGHFQILPSTQIQVPTVD